MHRRGLSDYCRHDRAVGRSGGGRSPAYWAAILARDGLPLGAILPITIAGGLLFGLLNGLLVTKIKLQPFITTLATMSIARGLAYIISQVKPVRIANESLNAVGSLQVLTVPLPVLILVVLIAVFGILLAKTEFGRNVYLVGGNPEAAVWPVSTSIRSRCSCL